MIDQSGVSCEPVGGYHEHCSAETDDRREVPVFYSPTLGLANTARTFSSRTVF